jgi:hypothetical protein
MSWFMRNSASAFLATAVLAATIALPLRCLAQESGRAQTRLAAEAPHADAPATGGAATVPAAHPMRDRIGAAMRNLSHSANSDAHVFERAEAAFPAFCRDWESKLHERERNNLSHITWKPSGDEEVGDYVGYGSIKTCTCKNTPKGIPIGKVLYQEFEYHLEGKSLDEAKHAAPKPAVTTNTTEIFRWDLKLGKWIF